ncbi:MAG: hypothetical protein S4CHLAM6_11950 [Chlamydiae bacterium]|nr:hypothetical protein [Chlamydiota bacterium]
MLIQIGYLILAALGLGFLIFIHEMGHYWMARRVGMNVEAFSIGFGSPLYSWEKDGVQWRIGWIPFGGYVKIAGEKKEGGLEPNEIPGGYFSKKPFDRIKVAAIAPIINLVFAFAIFSLIWAMGGREKPFHDLTNRIGWVDPSSQLYQEGIRPGDEITLYSNRKFHGFKDIFQSTMLSKNSIRVKGYHYDYITGTRSPFDIDVKSYQHPDFKERGIMTAGILGPANYMIYNKFGDQPNPIFEGTPMADSGLSYGDRIVWVDGELMFSNMQLNSILNSNFSLLTIERNGQTRLARIPLSKIGEYKASSDYKSELGDLKYEAKIGGKLSDLLMLPYQVSSKLEVEVPMHFIEKDNMAASFSSNSVDSKLLVGDKITAVDGKPVKNLQNLLSGLQSHEFNIIVQSNNKNLPIVPWEEANNTFEQNIDWTNLNTLKLAIGQSQNTQTAGMLKLLKPIKPMTMQEIATSADKPEWTSLMEDQRSKIEEIADPEKREMAMTLFNANLKRLFLGVSFQDRQVNYNPAPYILFGRVTGDIYHTMKALVTGGLNPKWLSGPIGIVQVMQQGWSLGIKEALYWLALISLNLGILNLLPIPVLDGGQICFALYEQITRKPLKSKTMEKIVIPFMIIFIGLFVFVTFHDLSRLIKGIF